MHRSPPLLALALAACGPSVPPPRTVDTSCGLDCEAQARYGLVVDRCFEYSDDAGAAQHLPALAVRVLPPVELASGGKALPLEYTQGGLLKMTDLLRFEDLDLQLARRQVHDGRFVRYLGADGSGGGVTWVTAGAGAGQTHTTQASTQVNTGSPPLLSESATFTVAVAAADASRQTVPAGTFPDALQLTYSEEPRRTADALRIFAPTVGFIRLDSSLGLDPGATSLPYYLQAVRDLAPGEDCGEGTQP